MVLTLEKVETTIRQACKSPSLNALSAQVADVSGKSGYHSLQDEHEDPSNPDPVGGIYVEPSKRNRSGSRSPTRRPGTPGSILPDDLDPSLTGSHSGHNLRCIVKSESESSMSSVKMVDKFSNMPWHVRGRAEAWEIERKHISFMRKIGEGMGGVVFLCRWRGLDCAAKLLSSKDKGSVEYHDMVNEISTISHLRHPNLVLFLGAITVEQPLLILSEYMAGGSLEDRYIIHRDLKPANLLLTDDDRLKVSDFGLCKTLQKVKEDGTPYTMTGCTGTKRYMAPEVVLSHPNYNEKVDVYSMAMIFYYIVVGERPFEQTDPELISVLAATRGLRPEGARMRWPEMKELVETMWEEDPNARPTAVQIVETLGPMKPVDSKAKGFSCNMICSVTAEKCSIQ